jgi:superfamily I DNA/RNA helicase
VAGSGKTVLAITKARSFADEGKRVLFLCFNEMLAEWLRFQLPEAYRDSVTIRNYHKLCREWVKAAGLVWPNAEDEVEFFKNAAPALLEQAIDLLPERCFDAIVVDEGQDFIPAWWDTVELINKRPTEGPLYIFFDPEQQIFQSTPPQMPDLGTPFLLPVNCRNTELIVRHCGKILGKKIPVNRGTPEGKSPKIVQAPNSALQVKEVEKQISEWMAPANGLKSSQIAIVTRGKVQNSSLANIGSIAGQPVTEKLSEWRNGAGILLTSLYRFKGLETDALILADVVRPDPEAPPTGFRPQHFYVACSRAKHLLTIISRSEAWN